MTRSETAVRRSSHFRDTGIFHLSTCVYIDGFNLYNGAVKRTQFKWLDISQVCQKLLVGQSVDLIRYFTARVIGFAHDPQAPARQDVYLRALRTLPNVVIHDDGWFAIRSSLLPQYPLAYRPEYQNPPSRPPQFVQVQKLEEKRTDVDIATHLLLDCFANQFDEFAVISNDGDLTLPIEKVQDQFNKQITVINPHRSGMSGSLKKASSNYIRNINRSVLASSQFPSPLMDAKGSFSKPSSW